MSDFVIPTELAKMVAERRVIPFVGAGFSASLGLPSWRDLLASICDVAEDVPEFDDLCDLCDNNFLQVAEYLFIKSGSMIGPLRQRISEALRTETDPLLSTCHVELVNLGAPQVYTTNYDDLIERTFRRAGILTDLVALPRHLALGTGGNRTQIVKYHGDLMYEDTLVLTESSYYARLDFESPMDLKFRGDLLGRSVLFMGYGFGDINIRVIWFKLMQMMKDVPTADRPISWIVRLHPNPVLEALYSSVGLRTIVLDPTKTVDHSEHARLLGEFLSRLTITAFPQAVIPGSTLKMLTSYGLISQLSAQIRPATSPRRRTPFGAQTIFTSDLIAQLSKRKIPHALAEAYDDFLLRVQGSNVARWEDLSIILQSAVAAAVDGIYGPGIASTILTGLRLNYTRRHIVAAANEISWGHIYSVPLPSIAVSELVQSLDRELDQHEDGAPTDDDIAYCCDIVRRLLIGQLTLADEFSDDLRTKATDLVTRTVALYPELGSYTPAPAASPFPPLSAVEQVSEALVPDEEADDGDYFPE
ncbi:MAG TPA: SIR2 family protein [Mycobacteriales bacterium]|jgi:hypothetical protein|nr:SIR2 family protein [Mycobacteriales bacterium]